MEDQKAFEKLIQEKMKTLNIWLAASILSGALALAVLVNYPHQDAKDTIIKMALLVVSGVTAWIYTKLNGCLKEYARMADDIERALSAKVSSDVRSAIERISAVGQRNYLVRGLFQLRQSQLEIWLNDLERGDLFHRLEREATTAENDFEQHLQSIRCQFPVIRTLTKINDSIAFLDDRRKAISAQWDQVYANYSWWNKLKFGGDGPDFKDIDKVLDGLKVAALRVKNAHANDFENIDKYLKALRLRGTRRIRAAQKGAEELIAARSSASKLDGELLKTGLWFSALSLPVSLWSDLERAGDIYDALRHVNGNFSQMSDAEIWLQTLLIPSDRLAGLVALTKGAYFEQLVAADSGGQLHEAFNTPDTDIVIDGISYQLKATDSVSYVSGVADEIPVITTSEVALQTGDIDSGISNDDLSGYVDLALGGAVIDMSDTAMDAILSGVGGLGFMATVHGINQAAAHYEKGGDAVEALFKGAGVAIEGTARSLVGAAETGYKVLSSRPMRFIGRQVSKAAVKFDEKVMAAAENNDKKT